MKTAHLKVKVLFLYVDNLFETVFTLFPSKVELFGKETFKYLVLFR